MISDLFCDIHNNFPIYHIDLKNDSKKKLQCIKCVSNQKMEVDLLLLPDVINFDEKLFIENWPPLSDELLRDKIISLNNDTKDLSNTILDFYDKLTQEVIQILDEKKKQQLIQAQQVYDLKDKIIEQYCQMASLDKIKQCFIQENKQLEKIEQDLKNQIDSQHSKKDEYTSILSLMMQQYELISQLNIEKSNQIKQNILQILKILNLIPQNNFDSGNEINISRKNDQNNLWQKLQEENEIIQKDNQIIDNLIKQLDFCNNYLIQFINQIDWQLDGFLLNLQTFTIKNQIDSAEKLKDLDMSVCESQLLIQKHISQFQQKDLKAFNEFQQNQKQQDNIFISPKNIQNNDKGLLANFQFQAKLQVQKINQELNNSQCLIDYLLKPEKKYVLRINFHKSNIQSDFLIGIISDMDKQQLLDKQGIGYKLNTFLNSLVAQTKKNQTERQLAFTIEFRICIKDKTFKLTDFPNYFISYLVSNQQIQSDGKYYFGIQFLSNSFGNKLEIVDYQELDEYPQYW
ncbi:hypothetical protein ABPG72_011402 [Tetrahymena utriculariae]